MKSLIIALLLTGNVCYATDVFEAARRAQLSTLHAKINSAADANARDSKGQPLLMAAVESGDLAVVQFLLARGADPSVQDATGFSALSLALTEGKDLIAVNLIVDGAALESQQEPITFKAVRGGDKLALKEMLTRKPELALALNDKNENALFESVRSAQLGGARLLLAAGANRAQRNKAGQTPAEFARSLGEFKIARLLK